MNIKKKIISRYGYNDGLIRWAMLNVDNVMLLIIVKMKWKILKNDDIRVWNKIECLSKCMWHIDNF